MSRKVTESSGYPWKYKSLGGVVRVDIRSGKDLAHLDELDPKMWSVLSCPTKNLEFDSKTLEYLDNNADGKIRTEEVKAAAKWLTTIIKDHDSILEGRDALKLSDIDTSTDQGVQIEKYAQNVLKNLSLEKDEITVADTAGAVALFESKAFDAAWNAALEADKKTLLPFEDTAAALAACEALQSKIADYFMRCKLVAFNENASGALDVSADSIGAISAKDLSACAAEIATYPLAHPNKEGILKFEGINPAWSAAFAGLKAQVLDVLYKGADGITEAQWNDALAKFGPYKSWMGDKAAKTQAIINADDELKSEAQAIRDVDKLLHLYRDFGTFLRNYVAMSDMYDKDKKAIFQAGKLYVDERCCEMCIRVEDMGTHGDMASLSGMFLIYCKCTSKTLGKTIDIVAVMTNGNTKNLRPGKNATFYDRSGEGYEATIIKVVDNPINLKQAFWQPYRKFANFISEKINKNAADKENAVTANMQTAADNVSATDASAVKSAVPPFDIAKFAGIFAALGMGLAMIGEICVKIIAGVTATPAWKTLLVILGILLCISGPSCFLTWKKLRRRDLGPVLNANGWAINATILISILFGNTLTTTAKMPKVELVDLKARREKARRERRTVIIILIIIIFAALAAYLLNCFARFGLESPLLGM